MNETVNFSFLMRIIKERLLVIILCSIVGVLIGGYISFFWITPQYSAQTQMIAATKTSEEHLSSDITANLQLVKTYKELVLSDLVLGQVQERLATEYQSNVSVHQLRESITLEQQQESLFFSIRAVSDRPRVAAYIANTTSQIFQAVLAESQIPGEISITTEAIASRAPVSPNHKLNLVLSLFIGGMIGLLFVLLRSGFDQTVKSEQMIYEIFGINSLGVIPYTTNADMKMSAKDKELLKKTLSEDSLRISRRQRKRV
ncbi:YveK family protein [Enterococcus sp. AZ109]|uniref:YveK family protein n=1 Tax=Enterococcus sp. AZ109 TaxID=2774634 RepID=UPI003F25C6A3